MGYPAQSRCLRGKLRSLPSRGYNLTDSVLGNTVLESHRSGDKNLIAVHTVPQTLGTVILKPRGHALPSRARARRYNHAPITQPTQAHLPSRRHPRGVPGWKSQPQGAQRAYCHSSIVTGASHPHTGPRVTISLTDNSKPEDAAPNRPSESPGVATCTAGPDPPGVLDLSPHRANGPAKHDENTRITRKAQRATKPSGKCGPERNPRPLPFDPATGPKRKMSSRNSPCQGGSHTRAAGPHPALHDGNGSGVPAGSRVGRGGFWEGPRGLLGGALGLRRVRGEAGAEGWSFAARTRPRRSNRPPSPGLPGTARWMLLARCRQMTLPRPWSGAHREAGRPTGRSLRGGRRVQRKGCAAASGGSVRLGRGWSRRNGRLWQDLVYATVSVCVVVCERDWMTVMGCGMAVRVPWRRWCLCVMIMTRVVLSVWLPWRSVVRLSWSAWWVLPYLRWFLYGVCHSLYLLEKYFL